MAQLVTKAQTQLGISLARHIVCSHSHLAQLHLSFIYQNLAFL